MNFQNDIEKDIKFLAKSEIRLKILSELDKEPNNVRGIVKLTKITYSSVSSNIDKLKKNNHIKKVNNKYHVTPMTEVYLKSLIDFKNSIDMINDYDTFWDKHNLKQLSMDSVKSITDLKESQLIEATPVEIFKTHNTIKKQMIKSKSVKAIFPHLHPEYPKLIEKISGVMDCCLQPSDCFLEKTESGYKIVRWNSDGYKYEIMYAKDNNLI